MARVQGRGKTGRYPIAGNWVATDSVNIAQVAGTGTYPRQLFIPANARPGVPQPTICYFNGSPTYRGTNADPSVMNNTSHIAAGFPVDHLAPVMSSFGYNFFCAHFPGGATGEWPNAPVGRQAFMQLLANAMRTYSFDRNRIIGMAFSGGAVQMLMLNYLFPKLFAGIVILDGFIVQASMVDAAHETGVTPPDLVHDLMPSTITTNIQCWDEYHTRCGSTPLLMHYSNYYTSNGLDAHVTGMMARYTAAGKTVASYSTSTSPPALLTTDKYAMLHYSGYDHQGLNNNVPALTNTNLWGWMAARRLGEA